MSQLKTPSYLILKHKVSHFEPTRNSALKLTLVSFYAINELNNLLTFYATFTGLVSTLKFK